MKLYVYDHCPFCIRARMPFALKDIPYELGFQLNDDEATPISMIGQKMLPILEDGDGFMGESLDIVEKIDRMKGSRLFAGPPRAEITAWLDRWGGTVRDLVTPRTPDPVFPEFRTEAARAYFTAKKESNVGPFDALVARTDELSREMELGLAELAPILPDPEHPSINDILLFPTLRALSILPELALPAPVAAYRNRMSDLSDVPLVAELRETA